MYVKKKKKKKRKQNYIYVKILSPETMKLLGRTKSKITKDKNGENVPCLEITVVLGVTSISILSRKTSM